MAVKFVTLSPVSLTNGVATPTSSTNILCAAVTFQADYLNTGKIYLGASNVDVNNGQGLSAGEVQEVSVDAIHGDSININLKDIYWDTDTTGNKVRVTYKLARSRDDFS